MTIQLRVAYSETKSGVISARLAEAMTPENILERLMTLDKADYWIHNAVPDRVPSRGAWPPIGANLIFEKQYSHGAVSKVASGRLVCCA